MSDPEPLPPLDRLALSQALLKLPDPQFKQLVFALNPPPGILPADQSALGDRAASLLQWAENSGPGLAVLQQALAQITGERVSPGGQRPTTPETPAPASPRAKMKILILAANPKNTPHLRLDQEVRDIEEGLTRAQQRDRFELVQRWAARPRDVRRAILDLNPQIVHFSGHGAGEGGLALEDDQGQAQLVPTAALAGLFELFADQVQCVLLNACYSAVQGQAIAQHIPYVIGMKQAIGDTAAREFAVGFYDALGAGRDMEFAFRYACNSIQMAGLREELTPVFLRGQATQSRSGDTEKDGAKPTPSKPEQAIAGGAGTQVNSPTGPMTENAVNTYGQGIHLQDSKDEQPAQASSGSNPMESHQIFISYRWSDSQDITGRIYEYLERHFGANVVFRDVYALPLGEDYRQHLSQQMANCRVVVAVIGLTWATVTDEGGHRRLDNPEDPVRIEVEIGLARGIPVIPVLVNGARLPQPEDLPDSLQPLIYRLATPARPDPDFKGDMERLIRSLATSINPQPPTSALSRGQQLKLNYLKEKQQDLEGQLKKIQRELSATVDVLIADKLEKCQEHLFEDIDTNDQKIQALEQGHA